MKGNGLESFRFQPGTLIYRSEFPIQLFDQNLEHLTGRFVHVVGLFPLVLQTFASDVHSFISSQNPPNSPVGFS